jgi:hypothetical protein
MEFDSDLRVRGAVNLKPSEKGQGPLCLAALSRDCAGRAY